MCNAQVKSELWLRVLRPVPGRAAQRQRCSFPGVLSQRVRTMGAQLICSASANLPGWGEEHNLKGDFNYQWGLHAVCVLLLKSNLIERAKLP